MGKQRRGRPEGWRQWRAHAARARDRLGVSAGWCDWTQSSTFNKGNFTERELDCIDTAWAARLASLSFGAPPSVAKKDWWVNPTQGVQRSPWSDSVPTLCRDTVLYNYEHNVVLSGADHLRLQGFPPGQVSPCGSATADDADRDVAGEAFTLPCVTSVVYGFYLNPDAPWWR